jgi:hypothetical protein
MMALEPIELAEYPDFSGHVGDRATLLQAIDESLRYYRKPSSKRYFPYLDISHERAVASLEAVRELIASGIDGAALQREVEDRFQVYRSVGWERSSTPGTTSRSSEGARRAIRCTAIPSTAFPPIS